MAKLHDSEFAACNAGILRQAARILSDSDDSEDLQTAEWLADRAEELDPTPSGQSDVSDAGR